jgi:aspartate/methionine/tyrosine aminotransferase
MPNFPSRITRVAAPPIPAARAWAAAYDGAKGPAIDVTQAVPGYPAHPDLLDRIAANARVTGYGDIAGDWVLREALAADASAFYAAPIAPEEVAITAGCNLAFSMAMTAIAGIGQEVIVPTPWYFNHQMALDMLGIFAVALPCRPEAGFVPDVADAEARIRKATRAIVLVTPNNPTGAIYPPETIAAFADLCRRKNLFLVLDETYRDFLPGPRPHEIFAAPDWRDFLIHLYSFSKSYCIPGHRTGAIVAGSETQTQLAKVLDTFQICPPRAAQAPLAWAIPALADWRAENRARMAARADAFRHATAQLEGWRLDAIGTYFAYLRLPESAPDATQAAEHLAGTQGLMTLPGPFFGPGQTRHLRLAFANVDEAAIAQIPARLAGAWA